MAKRKPTVTVRLTPMIKFYIGVAVVVGIMVAILVLVLLPMFKNEEDLQRKYKQQVSEYQEMMRLLGEDPQQTKIERKDMVASLTHPSGNMRLPFMTPSFA